MRQLEQSLRRLKTDVLDLWQIHECVYDNDPERHFARDGAVEALAHAQREGKVRFVGFTGHKHPDIHLAMLGHDFPFDTCQLPLNCFDSSFRSFEERVLPQLLRRGIAPIGMKSLGGDARQVKKKIITAQEGLRYAMSLPVATTVTGIDSMKVLRQNVRVAAGFTPMSKRDMAALRRRVRDEAADGRFELYKTTAKHEGPVGRRQHAFPERRGAVGVIAGGPPLKPLRTHVQEGATSGQDGGRESAGFSRSPDGPAFAERWVAWSYK